VLHSYSFWPWGQDVDDIKSIQKQLEESMAKQKEAETALQTLSNKYDPIVKQQEETIIRLQREYDQLKRDNDEAMTRYFDIKQLVHVSYLNNNK